MGIDVMKMNKYGCMMEYPIPRYWREGQLFTITEGTSKMQRLIIAREADF
jgi:alkylation response protein AidB-like acyl-CoA dehydrogenase